MYFNYAPLVKGRIGLEFLLALGRLAETAETGSRVCMSLRVGYG